MERRSPSGIRNTVMFEGLSHIPLPTSCAASSSSLLRSKRNTRVCVGVTADLRECVSFTSKPHSSPNQYSVQPSKEKPMNPRTLNFFPPSFTVNEHLYISPLSGSRISPPVHWPPSFVRFQTIRRPTRRRSLRSPEHLTQRGSGSFGSGSVNLSIFP